MLFHRIMSGRNGNDHLSTFLLVTAVLLSFFNRLLPPLYWLSCGLSVWALLRIFSRDINRRRQENLFFLSLWHRFTGFFRSLWSSAGPGPYKHFRCPQCRQKLRLPRGKGKVLITCSSCGKEFMRHS